MDGSGSVAVPEGRRLSVDRWLMAAQLLVLLAIVCLWAALLAAHVADRYRVDHVSGVWLGLVHYAREGVLYPPLAEQGHYGGTRYMPIPIGLYTAAAAITDQYLASGKLLGHAQLAAVCLLALVVLRRAQLQWLIALSLVAAFLATEPALIAGHGLRQDALPVALQLGALLVAEHATRRAHLAASGLLCALAVLAKLTALWAAVAVPLWLLHARRVRDLGWFGAVFLASTTVLFVAVELLSGGGFSESMRGTAASADVTLRDVAWAPWRAAGMIIESSVAVSHVLPLALLGLAVAVRRRSLSPYLIAWPLSLTMLIVIVTHPGAESNHLIDFAALTAICAGYGAATVLHVARPAGRLLVVILLVWALAAGIRVYLLEPGFEAAKVLVGAERRFDGEDLGGFSEHVSPSHSVFSEDPGISVLLGQTPVVLDPYVFRSLAVGNPQWSRDLAERIRAQEFERIVLIVDAESEAATGWYRDVHLGLEVRDAVLARYRLIAELDAHGSWGYHVYVPADDP